MALLIYYSHNHKCFKSKFGSDFGKKIGEVNGFNEELVCIVPLVPPRENPLKAHFIRFLESVINRLKYGKRKRTKTVYIDNPRFPWWKV